jgi:hypothetical protein
MMPRGTGKTVMAIRLSSEKNIPILTHSEINRRFIQEKANDLNIKIPDPITVTAMNLSRCRDKSLIIDELEFVLEKLLKSNGYCGNIEYFTYSETQ